MNDDELVGVAYALLMAAILLADLTSSMSPRIFAAMPADLRDRMLMTIYQDAFNRLPKDVQDEARAMVMAEPTVQAARRIDGRK